MLQSKKASDLVINDTFKQGTNTFLVIRLWWKQNPIRQNARPSAFDFVNIHTKKQHHRTTAQLQKAVDSGVIVLTP